MANRFVPTRIEAAPDVVLEDDDEEDDRVVDQVVEQPGERRQLEQLGGEEAGADEHQADQHLRRARALDEQQRAIDRRSRR